MTMYEGVYLGLVIAAFLAFGATLYTIGQSNSGGLPTKPHREQE